MRTLPTALALLLLAGLAACASGPRPYGPAERPGDPGYSEQAIERDRFRINYRARDEETAREYALLRAAELTLAEGASWFRVVDAYGEGGEPFGSGRRTAVSIGGSAGSGGSSSVGVGIGIGLGGGGSGEVVRGLEILIGSGAPPDAPEVYDAAEVRDALLGAPP